MRVLVTGSNSGFGLATVLTLARAGHDVVATMRDVDKGRGLRATAEDEGLPVEIRHLDVTDDESVRAAVGDPGDLDGLVNNAGFEVRGSVATLDDELMGRQLDTNVLGPLRTVRAVVGRWSARGHGVVVNVSSIAGLVASPYGGAYSASKFALEGLTEALHHEVTRSGVRVHLIQPGRFDTAFGDNIVHADGWFGSPDQQRFEAFRQRLDRLGDDSAARGAGDGGGGGDGDGDGGGGRGAQVVADAIVGALIDPSTPLRTLVGADAELIAAVRAEGSFEDFEQTIRTALEWWD